MVVVVRVAVRSCAPGTTSGRIQSRWRTTAATGTRARASFASSTPTSRRPMIGYGIPRAC